MRYICLLKWLSDCFFWRQDCQSFRSVFLEAVLLELICMGYLPTAVNQETYSYLRSLNLDYNIVYIEVQTVMRCLGCLSLNKSADFDLKYVD